MSLDVFYGNPFDPLSFKAFTNRLLWTAKVKKNSLKQTETFFMNFIKNFDNFFLLTFSFFIPTIISVFLNINWDKIGAENFNLTERKRSGGKT